MGDNQSEIMGDGGGLGRDGDDVSNSEVNPRDFKTNDTNASSANTSGANNSGASNSDGNTSDANTSDANTSDANTSDANTSDANTSDANTSDANTSFANTSDTNASDAHVRDANASDANASDSISSNADASDSNANANCANADDVNASDVNASDAEVSNVNVGDNHAMDGNAGDGDVSASDVNGSDYSTCRVTLASSPVPVNAIEANSVDDHSHLHPSLTSSPSAYAPEQHASALSKEGSIHSSRGQGMSEATHPHFPVDPAMTLTNQSHVLQNEYVNDDRFAAHHQQNHPEIDESVFGGSKRDSTYDVADEAVGGKGNAHYGIANHQGFGVIRSKSAHLIGDTSTSSCESQNPHIPPVSQSESRGGVDRHPRAERQNAHVDTPRDNFSTNGGDSVAPSWANNSWASPEKGPSIAHTQYLHHAQHHQMGNNHLHMATCSRSTQSRPNQNYHPLNSSPDFIRQHYHQNQHHESHHYQQPQHMHQAAHHHDHPYYNHQYHNRQYGNHEYHDPRQYTHQGYHPSSSPVQQPPPPTSSPPQSQPLETGFTYTDNMANMALNNKNLQNKKVSPEDFLLLKVIGKGSYGKVMLVRYKQDGAVYAMKMLRKDYIVKRNQVEHTRTERNVLEYISSPFIVQLLYAFQTPKKLYFVLEYCPGGELFFHLSRAGRFTEQRCRFYSAEIILALEHLHKLRIVYRDLKPENVLLDEEGHIRLTDFGLSKEGIEDNSSARSLCGTPEYLAPEILNQTGHGKAVDWWSLGALIYEMLTGLPPFYTRDRDKLFANIRHGELKYPSFVSPLAKSLLKGLFQRDPNKRLGGGPEDAVEIKCHPFYACVDWDALKEKRVEPPFKPVLKSQTDVQYFDREFVKLPVVNSEVAESSLTNSVAKGDMFQGFTYEGGEEGALRNVVR